MMNSQISSLEELATRLHQVRQESKTKNRFPQELWEAIIALTHTHSISEVSKRLRINPHYLKQKIQSTVSLSSLDFREIPVHPIPSDRVVIEICSDVGMKARIEGPVSCLSHLIPLFRR